MTTETINNANTTSAAAALDLTVSPVPGQLGWFVLDRQGKILRKSQISNGQAMVDKDAHLLFQMLQESALLLKSSSSSSSSSSQETTNDNDDDNNDKFRRLTVSVPGASRYVVTLDDSHVYIVQIKNA